MNSFLFCLARRVAAPAVLTLYFLAGSASASSGSLSEFSPCTIGNSAGVLDAQCATLTVPLDYDEPAGDTLDLWVAKLATTSKNANTNPFTLIAGGPGQSATESFPSVAHAFRHIRDERDIILLDQRGTGQSHKLDCPATENGLSLEFDAEETRANSEICRAELEFDPRFFTTSVAVKDLELLRNALGAEQWNLYGVSYGTRVALHYLRRYPAKVRTVMLDAVVPPELSLGPDIALTAQRALTRLFDRCEDNSGCAEAFPELRTGTLDLLDSLRQMPRDISFEDISTGELRNVEFTDKHLAVTLRLLSYSAHGNAILPSMLYDAIAKNNFSSLARQTELQVSTLDQALATGMHNAIICTEDEPYTPSDIDRTELENTYLGAELLDAMKVSCEAWDAGVMDDDFKQPVKSDVPALIFSGSDDPITPPDYGEMVAQHLSNSKHVINAHQGHMQASLGCTPQLMAEFVNTASIADLPLACLERIRAPAFFIDANGPLP
jgi:pimeloyl-ACP methyl ester carboxylesterase